jgi:hypothetical protein
MTAEVNFIVEKRGEILSLPVWAVKDDGSHTATVSTVDNQSIKIGLGLSDGRSVEVTGIPEGTTIKVEPLVLPGSDEAKSPFSPARRARAGAGAGGGRN